MQALTFPLTYDVLRFFVELLKYGYLWYSKQTL